MKLKKILAASAAMLLISCTGYAKNNVSEIDITAVIRQDGSAYVTQTWSGHFEEGTENYIPIATDGIEISDLSVSDEYGGYTYEDSWDINADFDDKSRKCGINETNDGVELCFGISNYGENTYKIEYVVTDFIKAYLDFDGTNFMFVNPQMSTFPTNANIQIMLENQALDESNSRIWAFGFDGSIEFSDGSVLASTASPLDGDNSMIVMLQLNKGLIAPDKEISESFENVKNTAFEGSDYGYDDEEATTLEYIIGFAVLFGIFALIFWFIALLMKRKKAIKKFYNEANYFRDVPNAGNIEVSHFLAQTFDVAENESLIIGALMLSMINKGCIEPETEENVGMFGKIKQSVNMKLLKEPDSDAEKRLYNILVSAAGSDGILQEKELENYSYANPEKIKKFVDGVKENGSQMFSNNGGFIRGYGNGIKDLTETGKKELAEIMGLKKYLNDFSLIAEREIKEVIIWKDYMVYATLFGIADKVIKQFEKVYPDKMPEFENYNRNVIIAYSYYRSMHNSAERAMQQARTSGLGGSASLGGGGGFSGGGTGGGSR